MYAGKWRENNVPYFLGETPVRIKAEQKSCHSWIDAGPWIMGVVFNAEPWIVASLDLTLVKFEYTLGLSFKQIRSYDIFNIFNNNSIFSKRMTYNRENILLLNLYVLQIVKVWTRPWRWETRTRIGRRGAGASRRLPWTRPWTKTWCGATGPTNLSSSWRV